MNHPFEELMIKGVFLARVSFYTDSRGWLGETFRADWLSALGQPDFQPVMGYVSMTLPGAVRGPHEHRFQTDWFGFLGPSDFLVLLWDNRDGSPSFGKHLKLTLGESNPALLIVPPGVPHGYKNIGQKPGLVHNYPNKLYRGWNRTAEIDEIRHEVDPESPFQVE
ncbi:MAG: dTDP-4-dehydrorhamnose 3,5-epimerase family protein [bacterium]